MAQRLAPSLGVFAFRDEHGQFDHARMLSHIFNLEQQLREAQAALAREREISRTDSLTGLPNRRALLEHLETALTEERNRDLPYTPREGDVEQRKDSGNQRLGVAIGFIDLDGFKAINDTYGHEAGDIALQTVADFLEKTLRETDGYVLYQIPEDAKEMASRLGGDEFVIVLRHTNAEQLEPRRQELQSTLNMLSFDYKMPDGNVINIPIGGTLGLIDCDLEASAEENLKAADKVMYDQKQDRKNTLEMKAAHDRFARVLHSTYPSMFPAP